MRNRERSKKWVEKLNESYQPSEQKPILKIAELTLILPALGLFYIWSYFNKYGIQYYLYFDLKDALSVLYQNLMPVIYISVIMSLLLSILIPDVLRKRNRVQIEGEERKGFSILGVIITVLVSLVGFYVLLDVYTFSFWTIVIFLVIAAFSSIFIFLCIKTWVQEWRL